MIDTVITAFGFSVTVPSALHDHLSGLHGGRLTTLGEAGAEADDPDASPVSNIDGSWIFHSGEEHDTQGSYI